MTTQELIGKVVKHLSGCDYSRFPITLYLRDGEYDMSGELKLLITGEGIFLSLCASTSGDPDRCPIIETFELSI